MSGSGRGMLLIGGEGPSRKALAGILASIDFIIAADSGFDLARRLELEPDLLVGDLDSVEHSEAFRAFPPERIRRFPHEKDETDAEIGMRIFREMGIHGITLVGGGGGRLDHLLGIVSLFEKENPPLAWYTAREIVQAIEGELVVEQCRDQTVSFFPLGEVVADLRSQGLKWPLNGLRWRRGQAGISNLFCEDRGRVRVGKGRLLMIRTLMGMRDG